MPVPVTRAQVIAYRVAAQGLHREATAVDDLAVLDLGVQEAMGHPGGLAFAARLPVSVDLSPGAPPVGPGHALSLAWTLRGSPHVHRRADLDRLVAALYPLSEADATGRLNETGPSVAKAGITAQQMVTAAVDAMRTVVTAPTAKGVASTEVTRRLPPAMRRTCRPCGTEHVSDSAMRLAAPLAGLEIEPGSAPPVLVPRAAAPAPTDAERADAAPAAVRALALSYLSLLGPAGPREVAGYLDARRADVAAVWPDGLVPVDVDGAEAFVPEPVAQVLGAAPPPELVRLLGGFDPYLQARDRDLIVPEKATQKALWPVLGRPGALFVDGEVVGTWRTKAAGRRLTITVQAFVPLPPSTWVAVDAEAERVAQVRGLADVRVVRPE